MHRRVAVELAVARLRRVELLPLLLGELVRSALSGATLLTAERPLELLREQAERQLRIRDKAEVDREVLRDLIGVEVDVHDPRLLAEHALERRKDLGKDVGA